ncbi:MAG: hypothetical protein WBE68_24620 [Candidatus Nitrosopolaris sp.]
MNSLLQNNPQDLSLETGIGYLESQEVRNVIKLDKYLGFENRDRKYCSID